MQKRLALFDIGTNTVKFLISENIGGKFIPVHYDQKITRLGEGLSKEKLISDRAALRTKDAIVHMIDNAESFKPFDIKLLSTYPLRSAKNPDIFTNLVKGSTGLDVDVLDGIDEAKLSLEGANLVVDARDCLLFDIGGGSVEFISQESGMLKTVDSYDIGVVTLTEQYIKSAPVIAGEYIKMQRFLKEYLKAPIEKTGFDPSRYKLIGTAGTVTSVAAIAQDLPYYDRDLINNYNLSYDKLADLKKKIFPMTISERSKIEYISKGREDLIVAGIALIETIMDIAKTRNLVVSDYSLLEGYSFSMLS